MAHYNTIYNSILSVCSKIPSGRWVWDKIERNSCPTPCTIFYRYSQLVVLANHDYRASLGGSFFAGQCLPKSRQKIDLWLTFLQQRIRHTQKPHLKSTQSRHIDSTAMQTTIPTNFPQSTILAMFLSKTGA